MMFILQGEQWKTPEFCFWRGKRKKIHGGKKSKTTYPRKYQWSLFQATENALKVQISQLETTLKSDLNDKSRLTEALAREREAFAQMESDFQVWKSPLLQDIDTIWATFPCWRSLFYEHHALVLNSQDLQSKFLAMKEDAEKQEDKLRFFARVRTQHKLNNNNKRISEF